MLPEESLMLPEESLMLPEGLGESLMLLEELGESLMLLEELGLSLMLPEGLGESLMSVGFRRALNGLGSFGRDQLVFGLLLDFFLSFFLPGAIFSGATGGLVGNSHSFIFFIDNLLFLAVGQ